MDTKRFRTRTEFIERNNGRVPHVWELALDIGYSSVKIFSPNSVASFPSYAKKVPEDFQFAGASPKSTILYRDDKGQTWLVGEVAQDMIKSDDTSDTEGALYGRDRYQDEMFLVIARTGMGLGLMKNRFGEISATDRVFLQTGLPERYFRGDKDDLTECLTGIHTFELKTGNREWKKFTINLTKNDIRVMEQPKGTLFSICVNNDGSNKQGFEKYLGGSVIIFDAGFGTLDTFGVFNGSVENGETYDNLGMKRVLQETSKMIRDSFGVEVSVPAMQKHLETGTVRYINKRKLESKDYEFGDLLDKASLKVCDEAINKIASSMNVGEYEYFVVTGGTGEAWYQRICERLKGLPTLTVVPGNQNDALPFIYSNVMGYYLYRYNKLRQGKQ